MRGAVVIRARWWGIMAVFLLIPLLAWYFWNPISPDEPSSAFVESGAGGAPEPVVRQAMKRSARAGDEAPELPASLRGTQPPGGWGVNEDGSWEVTPELRLLFDYYLTALGEAPLDELVVHIRESLDSLPPEAREQALAVLEDYLDFRLALTELEEVSGLVERPGPDELARRLERIRSLRRDALGDAVAETFFAEDEALADYALERARFMADDSLSEQERKARLVEAESVLPQHMQASREAARSFREYRERVAELERSGAPRESIEALRAQQFGEEAAEQLAEVDRQRAEWDQRLSEYRGELSQLEAAGLSETELEQERQVLLERYFEEHEQTRVRALEQMNRDATE